MELFSKRNIILASNGREKSFNISSNLRNRLLADLSYIVSSPDYLDPYLLVNNKIIDKIHLCDKALREISNRELGYDITNGIDYRKLSFHPEEFEDSKFFDLIEIIIIFTKNGKRSEVIERIQSIFSEEGDEFFIHDFMIVKKDSVGLRSAIALIKEKLLRDKLESLYLNMSVSADYQVAARLSADIISIVFSGESSKKVKTDALDICEKVAEKWTDQRNASDLKTLLSDTVKNAKDLNNKISNIRHTERFTVPVSSPNFYKMIASNNLQIAELFILSMPELFIMNQDVDQLKTEYVSKYGINLNSPWHITPKKQEIEDEIDLSDLPF